MEVLRECSSYIQAFSFPDYLCGLSRWEAPELVEFKRFIIVPVTPFNEFEFEEVTLFAKVAFCILKFVL